MKAVRIYSDADGASHFESPAGTGHVTRVVGGMPSNGVFLHLQEQRGTP